MKSKNIYDNETKSVKTYYRNERRPTNRVNPTTEKAKPSMKQGQLHR